MAELSDAVIAVPRDLHPAPRRETPHARGLLNTSGYFNGLVKLLDQAVHDGFLNTDTRTTITVGREPVVLLERLLPTIATH